MAKIKDIENEIREIINWISVFDIEYDLPEEVVSELKERLQKVAKDLASIK